MCIHWGGSEGCVTAPDNLAPGQGPGASKQRLAGYSTHSNRFRSYLPFSRLPLVTATQDRPDLSVTQHPTIPQLYEIDDNPKRKEFLDELFAFMQKRGTPINRLPIMAKQVRRSSISV